MSATGERLQKILSRGGIASRRAAEKLIQQGKVTVNGRVVKTLGAKADPLHDRIEVLGEKVRVDRPIYLLFNKPRAVVTTLDDPQGRTTIRDFVKDIPTYVFPVGRLDYNTSGALLLTNDGDLAQDLLRPERNVAKTYLVKVSGVPSDQALNRLRKGIRLEDGYRTKPARVELVGEQGGHARLKITLHEGKNRQLHRMFSALGQRVMRLHRESFAGIDVADLPLGHIRILRAEEIKRLKRRVPSA